MANFEYPFGDPSDKPRYTDNVVKQDIDWSKFNPAYSQETKDIC